MGSSILGNTISRMGAAGRAKWGVIAGYSGIRICTKIDFVNAAKLQVSKIADRANICLAYALVCVYIIAYVSHVQE